RGRGTVFKLDLRTTWDFDPPTAVDACSGTDVTITPLRTETNGTCPQVITRTWTVTDACGNSTNCSQTVTLMPANSCFTLSLSATSGIAGGSFIASGTVPAGSAGVRMLWDDGITSRAIAEGSAGPDGSFQLTGKVPADA